MDMFSVAVGIAVGAAFSPFWMKVGTKLTNGVLQDSKD